MTEDERYESLRHCKYKFHQSLEFLIKFDYTLKVCYKDEHLLGIFFWNNYGMEILFFGLIYGVFSVPINDITF